jgi:hypothetical protein
MYTFFRGENLPIMDISAEMLNVCYGIYAAGDLKNI